MKEYISVKPEKTRLINLLEEIQKGKIKIPIFQRDFVWNERQMLQLFDSIEKGYPIGSLLFWEPEGEDFKYYNTFGPYFIGNSSHEKKYVLDGYQRLTTLFSVLINPSVYDIADNNFKQPTIYYDLFEEEFTYYRKRKKQPQLIPLYTLIDTFEFLNFIDDLRTNFDNPNDATILITRAKELATKLVDYEIPYINIKGGDISSSVDIFSRINSTGTTISSDWMVSALSYNPNQNFLFSDEISKFLKSLEPYNFDGLNRETILHCIKSATNKVYFDVKAEDIAKRHDFITLVRETLVNIKLAIRFLIERLNVVEYRLLPYNTQLIFLTEFFRINREPTREQIEKLINWFWITSYSNYFTLHSLSNQRKAFALFKDFALGHNEEPLFLIDDQKLSTLPFPKRIDFGSVRSKTLILFMLRHLYEERVLPVFEDLPLSLEMKYLTQTTKDFSSLVVQRSDESATYDNYNLNSKHKNDASILLSNHHWYDLRRFFIRDLTLDLFINNHIEDALESRISDIKYEESNFTESLNLNYSFETAS